MSSKRKFEGMGPEGLQLPRDLQAAVMTRQALSFLGAPVHRKRPQAQRKSLPHGKLFGVELACGHESNFIQPQPIKGSIVFCSRCDDYSKVANGPATIWEALGRRKPDPRRGSIQTLKCCNCGNEFTREWKPGNHPKYCSVECRPWYPGRLVVVQLQCGRCKKTWDWKKKQGSVPKCCPECRTPAGNCSTKKVKA